MYVYYTRTHNDHCSVCVCVYFVNIIVCALFLIIIIVELDLGSVNCTLTIIFYKFQYRSDCVFFLKS